MSGKTHCFAVCAYGESPYLEGLLLSLLRQTVKSDVFIASAERTGFIAALAEKYAVPYYVSDREPGIGADWNFAYSKTDADFVTLAHQDDEYNSSYAQKVMDALSNAKNPILAYTGYAELRGERVITGGALLNIKKALNLPMRLKAARGSRLMRRMVLAFGDPICCPSVCINRARFPAFRFDTRMAANLDWDAWERLSREAGEFIYLPEPLVRHRIHGGSATTAAIGANRRAEEDLELFSRFWPAPIARALSRVYALSEKSNTL